MRGVCSAPLVGPCSRLRDSPGTSSSVTLAKQFGVILTSISKELLMCLTDVLRAARQKTLKLEEAPQEITDNFGLWKSNEKKEVQRKRIFCFVFAALGKNERQVTSLTTSPLLRSACLCPQQLTYSRSSLLRPVRTGSSLAVCRPCLAPQLEGFRNRCCC